MRALFLLLAIAFSTTAQAMPFCDAPKPEFDNANGDNLQVWNKRCASVSAAALKIMDQRCGDIPADNKLILPHSECKIRNEGAAGAAAHERGREIEREIQEEKFACIRVRGRYNGYRCIQGCILWPCEANIGSRFGGKP